MDDDSDCDIFSGVRTYCNSNELDKILENIQPEKKEDSSIDPEHTVEIEKLCEYKSTRRKSTRISRRIGSGRGGATKTDENDTSLTSLTSECSSQKGRPRGSGRGRGRRKRGAKSQAEQNNVELSSSPSPISIEFTPQQSQSSTGEPQSDGRANRTARRSQCPEGPVVAVVNLGCDSDSDSDTPQFIPQQSQSSTGEPQSCGRANRTVINLGCDSDSDSDTLLVPIFAPRRGRARRDFLARKASELAEKSVVEIRSSSSENEPAALEGLEVSFDTINPQVSIKVWWNGKIEKFTMRKYQQFSEIIKIIADREQTSSDNILFSINEQIIKPTDSPDSINYKIYQFISGKVVTKSVLPRCNLTPVGKKRKDPNLLELKVQSNAWKKPLMLSMRKEDTFKVLYVKCAEELKVPYDNIKLSFDGDHIHFEETPEDLELEGQEVIDCQLL